MNCPAMRLTFSLISLLPVVAAVHAQSGPVQLAELTVSARVANQVPVGTYGMPVSALRYEPQVDLQTRSLGEAQADLTIRGGTFETVGFRLGGISLGDPQTGHYLAEIPVATEMLTQPRVGTGASLSRDSINATSGLVSYGWRPVRGGGSLNLVAGEGELLSAAVHQGMPG
ncbi:MAG: TonB-dependent receptor, partial [Verrucomicrobiales bacterium VVV1]